MKPAAIPQHASASKAIAAGQHFRGAIQLSQMPRLADQLAERSGSLTVDLLAAKDKGGAPWLKGTIRGVLQLTCQRGLHPFAWNCDLAPALRLVTTDAEEKRLLADCEPYRVEEDRLPLRELVEDEVLLALPMLPRCENPDCAEHL